MIDCFCASVWGLILLLGWVCLSLWIPFWVAPGLTISMHPEIAYFWEEFALLCSYYTTINIAMKNLSEFNHISFTTGQWSTSSLAASSWLSPSPCCKPPNTGSRKVSISLITNLRNSPITTSNYPQSATNSISTKLELPTTTVEWPCRATSPSKKATPPWPSSSMVSRTSPRINSKIFLPSSGSTVALVPPANWATCSN